MDSTTADGTKTTRGGTDLQDGHNFGDMDERWGISPAADVHGRLNWASSAGCAWVVGTSTTENVEAEGTWRLVRSHGVHSRTAGERALSNYEAELYGIIGFLRESTALP